MAPAHLLAAIRRRVSFVERQQARQRYVDMEPAGSGNGHAAPQSMPRLADETRIVSAAAEFGGFAVFLRSPGGALTPLPRPSDYYTDSPWDYGNQGSHSLTHAIARLLEVSDGIELTGADVSPEYLVIEAAVRDSSTYYLDLSVGHLRAQIAAAAST